jgi:sugar lactone lactonase YvrE
MYVMTLAQHYAGRHSSAHQSVARSPKAQSLSAMLALTAFCCLALLPLANAQQNNTIGTVAGGIPYSSVATQTNIPTPTGIAEDASGNLYIASQFSYYIYKVNPSTGALSVVAGSGIAGPSNGGDGGPATQATFASAVAVALDKSGNVYIVDSDRIRVVNTQGSTITVLGQNIGSGEILTVAGTGANCPNAGQVYPSCGDGGSAFAATFFNPEGIYIDGNGNIFVVDSTDEEIRVINTGTSAITVANVPIGPGDINTVAGNGYICNTPGTPCGDGGSSVAQGDSGAKLDLPFGVVTDKNGNIYIGDTRDQRIRCVVNTAGGCPQTAFPSAAVGDIVTYAGKGAPFCTVPTQGCGDGGPKLNALFHNPSGVWLDSAGDLYVADQWDNRIREVTPGANGLVQPVCGSGTAGYENGKCPKGAEFYGPQMFILDNSGNAYIADSGNSLIRKGTLKSEAITTIAGTMSVGDGNAASLAFLANPVDVKWDNAGANYYIVDNGDNRIREVNGTTGDISTVVNVNGTPTQWSTAGDNGPATAATLDNANGIAFDSQGNLYIADSSNSEIRVVNMQSTPITVATISIQPGQIAAVAGQLGVECLGTDPPCGDGGQATEADVNYPIAVAVDPDGNIYYSDYFMNRVRCIANVAGGCPNTEVVNNQTLYPTVAGEIVTVAGYGPAGPSKNGIKANSAKLDRPYGVGMLNGSTIFDDSLNNMVRCIANTAGGCGAKTQQDYIYDYALKGTSGFSGDGGPATQAVESIPQGLGVDPAGNVYFGGGADLVVRRVDAVAGTILTVAGNPAHPGDGGFGGDGGPSTSAILNNLGAAVNGNEELLIADQGNNRVRQVDMVPEVAQYQHNLNFGSVTVNQTSQPMSATFQNYGLADLLITSTQIQGADPQDFAIYSNSCVNQLAPGPESGASKSLCTVQVTFTPLQTGSLSATLILNTNIGQFTVNLIGTGQ